jgi:hypothetical protein
MPNTIPQTPGREQIVDLYALTLSRLRDVVSDLGSTQAAKRRAVEKIVAIERHISTLRAAQSSWAQTYITEAYKLGTMQDEEILRRYLGNEFTAQFSGLHEQAAMVAVEGAVADLTIAANAMEQTFVSYVRRAQVEGARSEIAREIGAGIIEGASRQTVSNRLLATLKDQVTAGHITVGRVTMNARSYADLLARTVSRAARTEGTLNRLKENGMDLVMVSNTGAVDWCTIYEGRVFSISGRSKTYPRLVLRPPYHPNCTHTLSAFIEQYATPEELEYGKGFPRGDLERSPRDMAKKYPVEKDDRRANTKKTQRAA